MIRQLLTDLERGELSWNDRQCVVLMDEEHALRFIRKQYATHFENLFKSGLVQKLVSRGLLQPGELEETGIPDYPLVIRHPRISFLSYPFEWPPGILKEVALSLIEIEKEANILGYTLYDPHPWNVAIHYARPVYLDYGSFTPIGKAQTWRGYDAYFWKSIMIPLLMYQQGFKWVGRSYLRDFWINPPKKEIERLLPQAPHPGGRDWSRFGVGLVKRLCPPNIRKYLKLWFVRSRFKQLEQRLRFLEDLRGKVEALEVSKENSAWSNYYSHVAPSPPWERDVSQWTPKERHIWDILRQIRPRTVLDIGANTGWFSIMAASTGASVVALDSDEVSVERLYVEARKLHADVLPLVMDIRQPSPRYECGIGFMRAASERLKSELVLALGIVHHLAIDQKISIERLVALLGSFVRKYLLLEFVPLGDPWAQMDHVSEEDWNIEMIKRAFSERFCLLDVLESYPQGRKLLLYRKRDGCE